MVVEPLTGARHRAACLIPLAACTAAGAALFAVRRYTQLDPWTAPIALAAIYASLLAVSVGPPVPTPRPRAISPAIALAMGAAAVLAVRVLQQPVAPADGRAVAVALALAAAVSEEAYFRRLVYGFVERVGGTAVVAALVSAAAFAAMHYPFYGAFAMPLDFGAGLLFAWQRHATGSWLVPAATHALANLAGSW